MFTCRLGCTCSHVWASHWDIAENRWPVGVTSAPRSPLFIVWNLCPLYAAPTIYYTPPPSTDWDFCHFWWGTAGRRGFFSSCGFAPRSSPGVHPRDRMVRMKSLLKWTASSCLPATADFLSCSVQRAERGQSLLYGIVFYFLSGIMYYSFY